ncbi:hypothetical protein SAMN05421663_102272 [Terribacillus halophilus]|uniref:Lipoprotein n=1 Tax=Terribacillus halophilus TaxID=361279 RepID=A0A1G6L6A2_9BACI|nr:hypothetical protein [Terribacillus halophilus]SDC38819.1 hypothetical protein SAMN05421663_102272 [Terribacillus halophilus]
MKKLIRAGASLAVISAFLLAGCSQETTSQDQEPKSKEKSEMSSDEQAATSSEPASQSSYQAIEPSEAAEPMESHYTETQLAEMPKTEAHGDDTERSVPLGQTLEKGTEDKSDGPLQKNRIVSYYGHPDSTSMGILGEYSPEELMEKLKDQTKAYSELDPERPAIPAIELIATVAQRNPGEDRLYMHATADEDIETYAKLAEENNALLILDVQLGRDTIMNQVKSLEKYLKLPYVHLAIDTEFHVKEGQVPGEDLGRVDGENVQEAIDYVSNLASENGLPDKVVVVHQFADMIINNKEAIHPTENVEVVLNNDGHGMAALKRSGYHQLVHNQPIQYGGFKVFYQKDEPVMTPEEVLELDPAPAFVNYQ